MTFGAALSGFGLITVPASESVALGAAIEGLASVYVAVRAGCELQYIKSKMDDDLYKLEEASKGSKGSGDNSIKISDKNMYQLGDHFNKHGRDMGYKSKKEYNQAAREFAEVYKDNPNSEIFEGKQTGRTGAEYDQIIIRYEGKQVIIGKNSGQIIDFYEGTDLRGFINIKKVR